MHKLALLIERRADAWPLAWNEKEQKATFVLMVLSALHSKP